MFARLRAVTRRGDGEVARVITNGVLALDTTTHQARLGSTECHLLSREYALLHALLLRPGLILSRSTLEGKIYSGSEEAESNAVECLIDNIRSKLGASAILTIRGVGWMVDKYAQPFP
jgi:two-component system OmpR family response regulator